MEKETTLTKKQPNRNKWLFLLLGFVMGLIVGVSLYFADIYHLHREMNFSLFKEKIVHPLKKETKTKVVSPQLYEEDEMETAASTTPSPEFTVYHEEVAQEEFEASVENELERMEKEVDFSLVEEKEMSLKGEVAVFSEVLLAEKRLHVSYLFDSEDTSAFRKDEFFMVEQWSSPIKNRHTYHLKNNVLKVKGVDIFRISIVKYEADYYLVYNDIFYLLSPNNRFERLIEVPLSHE